MADNVTFQTTVATPPSGTIQRTDDLGAAGHYLPDFWLTDHRL